MKSIISMEKAVPVPVRGKIVISTIMALLFIAAVFIGIKTEPAGDIPVALANGEVITPPYYITVDGKKTVLVESKASAQRVINDVINEYRGDPEDVLDIQLIEDTELEKMDIKNGDEPPDIVSENEAVKLLMNGDDGEGYLTVVVTKEEKNIETIECEEEYKPEPDMYVGETRVEEKGKTGVMKVTKKVVRENGETVTEDILEEEMLKEPTARVILTGTKNYDGYGGGNAVADEGVSYDENATYTTLADPLDTINITSNFGPRWGRIHYGLDMGSPSGSSIYAADSGTVYYAGYCGGYGNLIKIDHGNGMQTYYAHCSKLIAVNGQKVKKGEEIALVGSTGNSTGPHLHLEVIINGVRVDPVDFLDLQ